MKYIVKNCPALLNNETIYMECQDETTEHLQCWENEDCIIKQIVERANICLTPEVIELLEIEGVNE